MSEVDRVALQMQEVGGWCDGLEDEEVAESWRRLARWHLREKRRARGRTLGYVILKRESDESGEDCWFEIDGRMHDEPVNVRMTRLMGKEVARVVAVAKGAR